MSDLLKFKGILIEEQHSLDEEINSQLKKIRGKASKLVSEVKKRIDMVKLDSHKFEETIKPDSSAQVKYSQKIFEVIKETTSKLSIPQEINKKSLAEFTESTRSALQEQDEALVKFVKLLKEKSFKDRVKTLSKSLMRLNKDLTKLENFILKDYTPKATIEEVGELLSDILENIDDYENKFGLLTDQEEDVKIKLKEIENLEAEIESLKSHEILVEYKEISDEFGKIQRDLNNKFSNIRKAMRTYVNIQSKSKAGKDTSFFKELITDVASVLSTQNSINSVASSLREIDEEMGNGNLRLKKDKREAAREDVTNFLGGELEDDWKLVRELKQKKDDLALKLEKLDIDQKLEKMEAHLLATIRDKNRIFERELRNLNNSIEVINKLFDELLSAKGHNLNLPDSLTFSSVPEWTNITE